MHSNNNNQYYTPLSTRPWHNANQKLDLRFQRKLSEMKHETRKLDDDIKTLEKEIEELEAKKKQKEVKAIEREDCEKLIRHWSSLDIEVATDSETIVTFPFLHKGKECGRYNIGFRKIGAYWTVTHYVLPHCMKLISNAVTEARIETVEKLAHMIRNLQLEADLFLYRQEQFENALSLSSPTIRIYPSVNTLSVFVEFSVNDCEGSDMIEASAFLTYRKNKVLPEEPIFKFRGGTKNAYQDFKKQLRFLQCMPLKEAIMSAFSLDQSGASVNTSDVEGTMGCSEADVPSRAEISPAKTPEKSLSTSSKSCDEEEPLMSGTVPKKQNTLVDTVKKTRGRPRGRPRGSTARRGARGVSNAIK